MFDPEKVERFQARHFENRLYYECVRASDYDALLALYRELQWIDIADEKPGDCEPVIIFNPPRRVMAQYVAHIKPETPWNMMDGTYLPADAVVIWARLPPHPYKQEQI